MAGSPARLPAVLDAVRAHAVLRLGALFKGMLDVAETTLFEDAKNLPNLEQQRYMDLIVNIRRQRAELETQFGRAVGSSFMSLTAQIKEQQKTGFDQVDYESLSLVNTEEMDITVMVDTIVARARLDFAGYLSLLRRRFAHVLKRDSEKALPLDPSSITQAFSDSLGQLEMPVADRLAMLRIFQQEVLSELGGLLEEANQIMIDAGILPDLKSALGGKNSPAKRKTEPARPESKAAKAQLDTEEMFSFLKDVLTVGHAGVGGAPGMAPGAPMIPGGQYHGGQYVGGGGIGGLSASAIGGSVAHVPIVPQNIAPTAVVQAVATPDLVALLSQIQQTQPKAPLIQDASSPTVTEVRESIRDNLHSDATSVDAIKQADEDIINLVSMLFDFILDDDDLPTAMKALIGRLQIPLLKVAILDKSFFNAETHPARRLLNTLAKAGIGWSQRDPGGDVLYGKIEEVVFRILNEFIDDLGLFEELLSEFEEFYEQQQKREKAIDKRTRDAEEGRARADLARAMVQQTLNRRLTGRKLPVVVVKLLQEAWRNVLYLSCLRDTTDSESWKQAVKVVDALIWSVTPQVQDPEWLTRLKGVSPKLLNSLKKGLASAHYDALATESLLRELAQVHLELISGAETRTVNVMESKTATEKPSATVVEASQVVEANQGKIETIVLPTVEATPPPLPPEEMLAEDDAHVLAVNRLNVGSWIEFVDDDKRDRHKLVARIRSVDKLIFANRRGIKVAELTAMKLAISLSRGLARIIEEAEVVDRALESVIGNLREIKAQQPQPQAAR